MPHSHWKRAVRRFLPRSISGKRILAGPLRGKLLVTSWHDYPAAILGRTERPLLEWFGQNVRPGETWLDVGAHYGYTAMALARLVGPRGRVFAFEPTIATAGCLSRSCALNRFPQLLVLPVALGSAEDLNLHRLPLVRGMVDSTLMPEEHGSGEAFLIGSLDWLWPRICGADEKIDGIKIDVQGMEIRALEGMRQVLARSKPRLAVELHRGVNRGEFLDLVESLGYSRRAQPIEPISEEDSPLYLDDRTYAFACTS